VVASQLIPVQVGDIQIEVEAVRVAGTEPTSSGKTERAAGSVLEAFGRAQDAITEVARSTAQMIERAGAAARPDRVNVEFGLKFRLRHVDHGRGGRGGQPDGDARLRRHGQAGRRPTRRGGDGAGIAGAAAGAINWVVVTVTAGIPDARVPGYLGRLLDGDGAPVGTCFQVAPGVLVTAWHVLDDIGAAADDARVRIDPPAGGEAFDAAVARMDPLRDLAVLASDAGLPAVAGPLAATDQIRLRVKVTVTGHVVPDDPGHMFRFLNAAGEWAGGTARDDTVALGRMTSTAVVPGMSGAPVVRASDGAVAGVVSGRYNSADRWLAGTVWVARTEDLAVLLDGITEVAVKRLPLAGPVDLLLAVTGSRVRLTGPGIDVAAGHGGVRSGLAEAVYETRRSRARAGLPLRSETQTQVGAGELPLGRAARLLGESFLPGQIADQLAGVLAAAERAHQPVRFGLAVPPELDGLPWEALPSPVGRGPLALHPLASVYRKTDAAAGRALPGPLRIVVAIAAPEAGGGAVLDYERELRNVLAAVRAARQDAADVRVVPFATCAAIRAELDRGPAHVLHITGRGSPGTLALENDDGSARPVTAEEFVEQAVPPGQTPPVITLSACHTDAAK
jgi:hypothetical protein